MWEEEVLILQPQDQLSIEGFQAPLSINEEISSLGEMVFYCNSLLVLLLLVRGTDKDAVETDVGQIFVDSI